MGRKNHNKPSRNQQRRNKKYQGRIQFEESVVVEPVRLEHSAPRMIILPEMVKKKKKQKVKVTSKEDIKQVSEAIFGAGIWRAQDHL